MKICRFGADRLGVIEGDFLYDVTKIIERLTPQRWPLRFGDPIIAELDLLRPFIAEIVASSTPLSVAEAEFSSPIAWPPKIMAAPANYRLHVELDTLDPGVDQGVHRAQVLHLERPVDSLGLFLKASTSIVGPAQGITIDWGSDRRVDHEVEVAVVIGKGGRHIDRAQALEYVAGYALGLDVTVRGSEERSFRKSPDSFAVLGPWLTTTDEIPDPSDLPFWIEVNGERRQSSSTAQITVTIPELIEIASSIYTLYPGDVLMTGTPEGVGELKPGDVIRAGSPFLGEMNLKVSGRG
jgi:2-keto-4-pentenoate hydratase/2-oxohepta-3-ene-1,7-dioic acid hydratase (catechol pathway)